MWRSADGYSTYRPRRVVYYREAPRVLVVERVHYHRHAKHWKRHGFRPVTVYYGNGRYYDRWDGPARGCGGSWCMSGTADCYHECDDDRDDITGTHWDD